MFFHLIYSNGSGGNNSLGEQLRTLAISLTNSRLYLALCFGFSTAPMKPLDTFI